MAPIRLGFVGLSANGWAADTLVPPFLEEPLSSKYTVTAVTTSNSTSAAASAEKYSKVFNAPVKGYHGSTEQIANDPTVDMVAISIRTPGHVEATLPVLRAKKDLFIEWPAGNQLAGTTSIANAARESGVKTLVGFQTRQAAYVRKVKEILDSGKLGRIVSTSLVTCFTWPDIGIRGPVGFVPQSYLLHTANGASMVDIDAGHLIDTLHYLFGPIASVTSHLSNQYPTVQLMDVSGKPSGDPIPQDDIHQIVFGGQFGNKDETVFSVNMRNVYSKHSAGLFWIIDGEKGAIRIQAEGEKGFTFMKTYPELWLNGKKVEVETDTEAQRATRYWDKFADGQAGEYATMEDALQAKRVVNAIFTSNKEGRRLDLL